MFKKNNVYRRYALAFATFSVAISIGFLMQTNEASSAARVGIGPLKTQGAGHKKASLSPDQNSLGNRDATGIKLPAVPDEFVHQDKLPTDPIVLLVSRDLPIGALPEEEATPMLGCEAELTATPAAGAMVELMLDASCLAGERVTVHHGELRFTELVGLDGLLNVTVPALAEHAVFVVVFPNGDGTLAKAEVSSLPFYDRAAVVWQGQAGLQLHALEFGADYGTQGHVWLGASRDVTSVVGGQGGFLVHLGNQDVADGWVAEVYTFPTMTPKMQGSVQLSIEAEVTSMNCDQEVSAQSLQIHDGAVPRIQEIDLFLPECGAKGEFLVLKNLLQDLKIAQN